MSEIDVAAELARFTRKPCFGEKWNGRFLFAIAIYASLIVIGTLSVPSRFWDGIAARPILAIGVLALWRFGWWSTHVTRALIYGRIVFPRLRAAAVREWANGRRPARLHFMAITFRERPSTTRACIGSIIAEVRATGLPATIWLGSGEAADEPPVAAIIESEAADLDIALIVARQRAPGKRYAIGTALRAIQGGKLAPDDLVFFMDGDSVLMPELLERTTSLFLADPDLQALTTDEDGVVHGPRWMWSWLSMRFAQRRVAMQSHSLSYRLLTLTGRLSIIRARHALHPDFIEIVEEDHLDHWLWGRFRFLSGDDKSTLYYMLRAGAKMIYVPDALVVTIEQVKGSGYDRMVQNLRRWSGNMLRNGARAVALGPRRAGLFIWWCLVDQRLAMWTTLAAPALVISGAAVTTPWFMVGYATWILATRLMQSCVLWLYSREADPVYPPLLYFNQVVNAVVKVMCMLRLSKQRWTNRGDQRAGFERGLADRLRQIAAGYIVGVAVTALMLMVIVLADRATRPTIYTAFSLLARL